MTQEDSKWSKMIFDLDSTPSVAKKRKMWKLHQEHSSPVNPKSRQLLKKGGGDYKNPAPKRSRDPPPQLSLPELGSRVAPQALSRGMYPKGPISDPPRTQNCLRNWSKHVDMNSQIEALDELNNREYKNSRKNSSKQSRFSCLLT